METIIRKIQKSDNEKLATIIRSCFHDFKVPTQGTVYEDSATDHLYELFSEENSALFVAEKDGELCDGDARASGRHAHPAVPGRQSRSWRNRDNCDASPPLG